MMPATLTLLPKIPEAVELAWGGVFLGAESWTRTDKCKPEAVPAVTTEFSEEQGCRNQQRRRTTQWQGEWA
jgi:hypothetical protein